MEVGDSNEAWFVRTAKFLVAIFSYAWLSTPNSIHMLLVLMAIRFLTCLFDPRGSLPLLAKRLAYTALICESVHLMYSMGETNYGWTTDPTTFTAVFFSVEQVIAILRNGQSIGVGLPPKLIDWLVKAEGLTGTQRSEMESSFKVEQSLTITKDGDKPQIITPDQKL